MRRLPGWAIVCTLGFVPLAAFGEDDPIRPGEERVSFFLGTTITAFKTRLRIDNATFNQGTSISLSDDLGVNNNQTAGMFGVEWRTARNHRLGISYSRFRLTGDRVLSRQLDIGDETFPVGAAVSTEFIIEMIPIAYSYTLMRRERSELAFAFGLNWSRVSFGAKGSASLNNTDANAEVTARADIPLPLFGLRYDHRFSQEWSGGLRAGYFAVKWSNDEWRVKGRMRGIAGWGEYRLSRHWGIGFGIESFAVDVDGSSDTWSGEFHYSFWGPQFHVRARF